MTEIQVTSRSKCLVWPGYQSFYVLLRFLSWENRFLMIENRPDRTWIRFSWHVCYETLLCVYGKTGLYGKETAAYMPECKHIQEKKDVCSQSLLLWMELEYENDLRTESMLCTILFLLVYFCSIFSTLCQFNYFRFII